MENALGKKRRKNITRTMAYSYDVLKKDPHVLRYERTEHWNQWAKVRQDLFHLIDILALTPSYIWGIQVTSHSNNLGHIKKALQEDNLKHWLRAGGRFTIWGWYKEVYKRRLKLTLIQTEFFLDENGKVDMSTPNTGKYKDTLQKYREKLLHVKPQESTEVVAGEPPVSTGIGDSGSPEGT